LHLSAVKIFLARAGQMSYFGQGFLTQAPFIYIFDPSLEENPSSANRAAEQDLFRGTRGAYAWRFPSCWLPRLWASQGHRPSIKSCVFRWTTDGVSQPSLSSAHWATFDRRDPSGRQHLWGWSIRIS
jgi:hypothetical protein